MADLTALSFEKSDLFKRASIFFPLMERTQEYLKERGNLRGVRLGWHCHLTALTALAAKALVAAGCQVIVSECNPATSDQLAIDYMKELGVKTFSGYDGSLDDALKEEMDVISDTGFVLLERRLSIGTTGGSVNLAGACEITTSGITRLRAHEPIEIPVININEGELKSTIENFHGVGDGVLEVVRMLTGCSCQGQKVAVVGYGRVGAGAAHYLSRAGALVTIVEPDPVRQLIAHFDGFNAAALRDALQASSILVTATGRENLLTVEDWLCAKDGLMVINIGHWKEELGLDSLRDACKHVTQITKDVDRYVLDSSDGEEVSLYVATQGNPANVALLTGSIEPTLIHLATELLSLEYLIINRGNLESGEQPVPREVECSAAELAIATISRARR